MGRHTPKHEHQWIYDSDLADPDDRYVCRDCGATLTEPRPATIRKVDGL